MPAIIDKADGRKTVHDASEDMAKIGTNAAAGRKTLTTLLKPGARLSGKT